MVSPLAEKDRMKFWKERAGGGEVELHNNRFLVLTHRNDRPLVSGAAEEGGMVLLEEVVAMFLREEADGLPRETSEACNADDGEDGGVNLGVEVEEREGWPLARKREQGSRPGRRCAH